MNTKNILIGLIVLAVIGGIFYWSKNREVLPVEINDNGRMASATPEVPEGKLKVINFSGKLEEVNEGCYVDGECYAVIDGKHVTAVLGWRQEVVGSVLGVESFGDLKRHIGEEFEVYAEDKGDGTYTLYGSEGFYIKLK